MDNDVVGLRVRRLPYANLDPGGRNLVDDYLKRSGWKESVQAKAYMKTLRTSVMSLYEVSEIATKLIHEMLEAISGGCPAGLMPPRGDPKVEGIVETPLSESDNG